MVINLEELMKRQEKQFYALCDFSYPEATKVAFRIADRWNRVRKAVEYQKQCI
ncbi:hypothetical protein [Marinisporobacter balticus]|uniref:hypothetical protein n=1 Tax=Marinisporobacter balticus TaxID=2018667 RepID=UPI0014043EB3|nr:hypothetical protein [Marinisporobacter balticus]